MSSNRILVSPGVGDPQELTSAQVLAMLGVENGSYVPTISATTNLDSYNTSTYPIYYSRIGDRVNIQGQIQCDPITASNVAITMKLDLPINSNFTTTTDAGGMVGLTLGQLGTVGCDTSNDLITFNIPSNTTAATIIVFNCWYIIK